MFNSLTKQMKYLRWVTCTEWLKKPLWKRWGVVREDIKKPKSVRTVGLELKRTYSSAFTKGAQSSWRDVFIVNWLSWKKKKIMYANVIWEELKLIQLFRLFNLTYSVSELTYSDLFCTKSLINTKMHSNRKTRIMAWRKK